jgi:hypothetical protein
VGALGHGRLNLWKRSEVPESFTAILDEVERWAQPKRFQKFLIRERAPSTDGQSLSFYAFSYAQSFDRLAESVQERWSGGGFMQRPVFYLARHSIELHLKWAIDEYVLYTGDASADFKHNLLKLWCELNRQFALVDAAEEDDWGKHCGRLVKHIHDIDPTGEAFRYPHNLGGKAFDYTFVEFKGLVDAHRNVTSFCGASLEMIPSNYM